MSPALVNHVRLDGEVLLDKFRRERVVRDDAAHLSRSEEYVIWLARSKEAPDGALVGQIEFASGCV